mgnify:FL=1
MKNTYYLVIVLVLFSLLGACSNKSELQAELPYQAQPLPVNEALFNDENIEVIDEQAVFALSKEQEQEFLSEFHDKLNKGIKPHHAIRDFLQNQLSNFTYYGETYIAEKAMRLNQGNCMSLAILTTAVAQLTGVEFAYREVNTLPVFEKKNNLILSSSHVQTLLYDPEFTPDKKSVYFSRPGVVIDYFPNKSNHTGRKLSTAPFLAMYYKNIASDALVENDFDKAFAYASKANQLDPGNSSVINFLAVLHKRKGDLQSAEAIYKVGLALDANNLALLSNYLVLLDGQDRDEEARKLSQQLESLDDPNPYSWLEQAYLAQDKKDFSSAARYYKKVLKIAPYVNQAYQGLYQIYSAQGKNILARKMLQQALEWTYEINERKLYKYKLYNLEQKMPSQHKRKIS